MEKIIPSQENFERLKKFDKWRRYFSRVKRKILSHVWFARGGILLIFFSVIFIFVLIIKNVFFESSFGYYFGLSKNFIFTPENEITSINDRVNLVILGKGGGNHEAPDLTDTILFVSVNSKDNSVTMISLPRDIWIPKLRAKLNSVYYWGNERKPPTAEDSLGGGLILTKSVVEEIVGLPVQYGIVIDFEGFRKVIDILGGIEVTIDNSFTDYKYPIPGRENDDCVGDPELKCRYEILSFTQGKRIMDGETALKFARSRNAEGDEGTDFARSRRQQKVIAAIKNKIMTWRILLSPKRLSDLKTVARQHIEKDIGASSAAVLARYFFDARDDIKSYVLPEDFLINPPKSSQYDNLYVFIPKDGNWDKVQEWVREALQ